MRRAKIAIIGAGVSGIWAGVHLKRSSWTPQAHRAPDELVLVAV
jgi:cation diffusion facilitator CzcD-associated flavoprotein CzcO